MEFRQVENLCSVDENGGFRSPTFVNFAPFGIPWESIRRTSGCEEIGPDFPLGMRLKPITNDENEIPLIGFGWADWLVVWLAYENIKRRTRDSEQIPAIHRNTSEGLVILSKLGWSFQ